ncbi:MAG: hypothetical protein ACRCVE_11450 [Plesiomonas sp.]
MFEQYIAQPNRKTGNIELLKKYQQDIDAISCIFDEHTLFSLMTELDVNGHGVMKHISQVINIISSTAFNANQINMLQYTDILLRWVHKFSLEAKHVMLDIYANRTTHNHKSVKYCNRIPKKISSSIDLFINNILENPSESGTPRPLSYFINSMDCIPYYYSIIVTGNTDGQVVAQKHKLRLQRYTKYIYNYLISSKWLASLPKHKNLKPYTVSILIFAYFCTYKLKSYIEKTVDEIKPMMTIEYNGYINHPEVIQLITLTMTFYEVLNEISIKHRYKNTLTPPDRFIFAILKKHNVANFTGISKTQEQLIRKTYIYLALLLNPEWEPSAKEILKLLSGEHSSILGKLDFDSTSLALETQINNVSLMSNENYFENFLATFISEES